MGNYFPTYLFFLHLSTYLQVTFPINQEQKLIHTYLYINII